MGELCKATDTRLNRTVAIKVVVMEYVEGTPPDPITPARGASSSPIHTRVGADGAGEFVEVAGQGDSG